MKSIKKSGTKTSNFNHEVSMVPPSPNDCES